MKTENGKQKINQIKILVIFKYTLYVNYSNRLTIPFWLLMKTKTLPSSCPIRLPTVFENKGAPTAKSSYLL